MTKFLDYFRKIQPLNTFFGLYAARENIFCQKVATIGGIGGKIQVLFP